MSGPTDPERPSLDAAYRLSTPEDNRRLYGDWAGTYDGGFAARTGYRLPDLVAARLAELGAQGPVLDAGAGTGLVGLALAARRIGPVDGIDISPEMLARAAEKGCYRHLLQADLTGDLPPLAGPYAALASAGTFTHGHLGPEVLGKLVAVMAPGAWAALSVNIGVWDRGFGEALAALPVGDLTRRDDPIYTAPDEGHAADRAAIVAFRKR